MARSIGLVLGVSLLLITLLTQAPEGMTSTAWLTSGVAMLMAAWWMTEAIPVAVTSLLPLVLFPLLGLGSIGEATAPYAHPVIYLLMGGFIIATALQRWQLHRRIALKILAWSGSCPRAIVGGFMLSTAFMSMWISNTATTLMMIPIALSLSDVLLDHEIGVPRAGKDNPFTVCLLLGIVYAASIGGLATLVGTPPNALVAAFMSETYDVEIGFARWMMLGLPVVLVFIPFTWWVLTSRIFDFELDPSPSRSAQDVVATELAKMGPISMPEKRTAIVFVLVVVAWITRPLLQQLPGLGNLNDTLIAIVGAVTMFLVPAGNKKQSGDRLLDWRSAEKIPWGVLILFGGGLSLANHVSSSGLALWLGDSLSVLTEFHLIVLLLCLVTLVIFLTELTSNTATTAALLPLVGGIAVSAHYDPMLLAPPMALAASCAFMLPVATPPNAIAYASGEVTIQQMMKAGVWVNIAGIAVISLLSYLLIPIVFL